MFALGNGMGAPLLLIGASGGKLLPKAGGWMDTVKAVFGVVLLGVAVLMLERVLPGPVTLALWALLLIIPAIYLRALDPLPENASGWRRLWKGLGIAMLIVSPLLCCLCVAGLLISLGVNGTIAAYFSTLWTLAPWSNSGMTRLVMRRFSST